MSCEWTCSASNGATCPGPGSGDIDVSVALTQGGGGTPTATFAATCQIGTSIPIPPPETLDVTASVVADVSDPDPGNNEATDSDALVPVVDVAVSINDGVSYTWWGHTHNYRIGVRSTGADAVVRLINTVPPALTSCSWTCESLVGSFCPIPASGFGSIDVELTLPANSGGLTEFVRFTSTCGLSGASLIKFTNTALLELAPPFRDSNPANNQSSDIDFMRRTVDLSASVTDNRQYVHVGELLEYEIRIDNAGPENGEFLAVFDTFPAGVSSGLWTCSGSAGVTCSPGVGNGLFDSPMIPAGGHVNYLFSGVVQPHAFTGPITHRVEAYPDLEAFDPTPNNNLAMDEPADIVVLFRADFDFP
jgi:uncharacterized repeat protein (TIGR01451 family)